MTLGALVDNDVLQKFSLYGLIVELESAVESSGAIGVLGAARFIVRRAIKRLAAANVEQLSSAFEEFIGRAVNLEPTTEEIEFATEMEEVANRYSLGFDGGESQLCAIAITRGIGVVITGDKREIKHECQFSCRALHRQGLARSTTPLVIRIYTLPRWLFRNRRVCVRVHTVHADLAIGRRNCRG